MSVIKSSLFHVIKRFPFRKKIIHSLLKSDDGFHTLCNDYQLCFEALTKWNQSTLEEAPVRRTEYEDLLRGLELEIAEFLNEKGSTMISGKGVDRAGNPILIGAWLKHLRPGAGQKIKRLNERSK